MLGALLLTFLAQNASIQGAILRGANDPLSKAIVELRTDDKDAPLLNSVTTEDDGRFLFQNVRPGRYRLTVTRQGYTRPPLTITVVAGQPASDLRLTMTPAGAIYGQVYDGSGEPLGNIEVQALKATYSDGRRILTAVQSVQTNDLGEYRLFWLAPGRYFVSAVHPKAQSVGRRMMTAAGFSVMVGGGGAGNNVFIASSGAGDQAHATLDFESRSDSYVPIYFPGTIDEQSAIAIDVRAGADLGGVNIPLSPVRARHVRGYIVDAATGKPAEYPSLNLADDVMGIRRDEFQVNPENGSFDITLLPGVHTLNAGGSAGAGVAVIRVGDADIENLTIAIRPSFDLAGRIVVEGQEAKPPNLEALRLHLRRDPPPPVERWASIPYSHPLPDGSFTLEGGAGDFRVNIAPILEWAPLPYSIALPRELQDAYVKSIRLGNADVLNGVFHLEKPPEVPLEVVIGVSRGALEGIVANGPADCLVVLVPDVRRRTDLYKTTSTDSSGRFRFDRIPPGDYKVFAWQEVDDEAWYDPEFMRAYENRGTPVRIVEGQTQTGIFIPR